MKNIVILIGAALALLIVLQSSDFISAKTISSIKQKSAARPELMEGDIIFQSSVSDQCLAIQLATHSKYSHVGMLTKKNGAWMVFEAVQPVCLTPLNDFIARGEKKHYVIKRLKEGTFGGSACLAEYQKKNLGKDYDAFFGWGDDKLYCSELVWKAYKECCAKEPGKLEKIKDLDLSHPVVKAKLTERYGAEIPYEEKVITPGAMFESEILKEVYRN